MDFVDLIIKKRDNKKLSKDEEKSLLETEREELGMDHSLIGRRVADKWNLPIKITKVRNI